MLHVPSSPQQLGLPFDSWRPEQPELIERIGNTDKRVVACIAPTGFGKSGLAIGLIEATGSRGVVLTGTKQLQAQYSLDFFNVPSVKGMGNFRCHLNGHRDIPVDKAMCQTTAFSCQIRSNCNYYMQRERGARAQVTVTNYDYGLKALTLESPVMVDRTWLVADEAHYLDEKLTDAYAIDLNENFVKTLGRVGNLGEDHKAWREWAAEHLEGWRIKLGEARKDMSSYATEAETAGVWQSIAAHDYKIASSYARTVEDIVSRLEAISGMPDTHVISNDNTEATIRPLWISDEAAYLFSKFKHSLLMSATLPPKPMMARMFNLDESDIDYVAATSTFPVENRPVYVAPVGSMTRKEQAKTLPRMGVAINRLLDNYPNDKTLIHTHTNKLRDWVVSSIDRQHRHRIITHSAYNRDKKIREYRDSKQPLIMVSPSLHSGLDCPDLSLQVIIKVPWALLTDRWVSARMRSDPDWYTWQAVAHITQAIGRAPRSDDWKAKTYILDSNFAGLWNKGYEMFPRHVEEAIHWVNVKR